MRSVVFKHVAHVEGASPQESLLVGEALVLSKNSDVHHVFSQCTPQTELALPTLVLPLLWGRKGTLVFNVDSLASGRSLTLVG